MLRPYEEYYVDLPFGKREEIVLNFCKIIPTYVYLINGDKNSNRSLLGFPISTPPRIAIANWR